MIRVAPPSDKYVTRRYKSYLMHYGFIFVIKCKLLKQDNAPCHAARGIKACNACKKQRANTSMACEKSAFKSDRARVGPVEAQVRDKPLQPNIRELTRVVNQMWAAIQQRNLNRYIISMRARCRAVIAAAGGHTKY